SVWRTPSVASNLLPIQPLRAGPMAAKHWGSSHCSHEREPRSLRKLYSLLRRLARRDPRADCPPTSCAIAGSSPPRNEFFAAKQILIHSNPLELHAINRSRAALSEIESNPEKSTTPLTTRRQCKEPSTATRSR